MRGLSEDEEEDRVSRMESFVKTKGNADAE